MAEDGGPAGPLLSSHTGAIRCLAFGTNSERFVTGAEDGLLREWELSHYSVRVRVRARARARARLRVRLRVSIRGLRGVGLGTSGSVGPFIMKDKGKMQIAIRFRIDFALIRAFGL